MPDIPFLVRYGVPKNKLKRNHARLSDKTKFLRGAPSAPVMSFH